MAFLTLYFRQNLAKIKGDFSQKVLVFMDRELFGRLNEWKLQIEHIPLLLRGARQVGKSYLVEQFGRRQFKNFVEVNFEYQPEFKQCFTSLNPEEIVNKIALLAKQPIEQGETLLFLDEIQECPEAILALRYFKERMPTLHVIGAGSLLEFTLEDENFRMPVGRVQYIYLKPLSFREFLSATGNKGLIDLLRTASLKEPVPEVLHQQLIKLVQEYAALGGMPAVLDAYIKRQNITECQRLQTLLLATYRNDFGKYTSKANYKYLQRVFETVPALIGQQIKYTKIDPEMRSRDLKMAITKLTQANIISPVYASSASGLPLGATVNEKKFKLTFLDTGLTARVTGISTEILLKKDAPLINDGTLAEQFVGQELLAYTDAYEEAKLNFWHREKASSMAEVDYVMAVDKHILGIEVKAGVTGRLKSLRQFMHEKHSPLGVRISKQALSLKENVLSIPFYLISELPRLAKEALRT